MAFRSTSLRSGFALRRLPPPTTLDPILISGLITSTAPAASLVKHNGQLFQARSDFVECLSLGGDLLIVGRALGVRATTEQRSQPRTISKDAAAASNLFLYTDLLR